MTCPDDVGTQPVPQRVRSGQTRPVPSSLTAQLSVINDHVDRYREQIADLARTGGSGAGEDAVAAMFEAERALRTAARALQRATKLAG